MNTLNTTEVWNDFSSNLHQYIVKKVQSKEVANDISQEVFIKLHQHLASLKDEQKVTAWLFRIAHHQIMDYYRQDKKRANIPAFSFDVLPAERKDETQALATCMHDMIAALPPKYEEAVRLTDIEGLSQKELAERLGISYSGAKSRVQRGRAALKALFLQCCTIEHDKYGNILNFRPRNMCDESCD